MISLNIFTSIYNFNFICIYLNAVTFCYFCLICLLSFQNLEQFCTTLIFIQLYSAEEAERFYKNLQDLLELTPKKDVFFIIGDWNAKVGSQETPGVTGKFGLGIRNEAGQRLIRVLPRKHTGHSKHPLPTTQEKTLHMDITRWSTPKSD